MAVAYGNSTPSNNLSGVGSSAFTNTAGNVVVVCVFGASNLLGTPGVTGVTYAGQALTTLYNQQLWTSAGGFAYQYAGYLLNAPTGANTVVTSTSSNAQTVAVRAFSISGCSTTIPPTYVNIQNNGSTTGASGTISSASNQLVILNAWSISGNTITINTPGTALFTTVTAASGESNRLATYTGTASVSGGFTGTSTDYFNGDLFSFAPPNGVTPVARMGGRYVSNQIQTTPGNALGVVGNANNGLGDDVGGSGLVDIYTGVS